MEGTLQASGSSTAVQLQGGVLSGDGMIDANTVNNVGGTVVPGLSPGTLILDDFGTDVVRLHFVSSVPVPPAVWLFGSGLLGLIGISRRRKGA